MSLALSTDYTERLYMAMEKDNVSSVSAPLNSNDNVLDNDLLRNNLSTVPSCSYRYSGWSWSSSTKFGKNCNDENLSSFSENEDKTAYDLASNECIKAIFWHSPQLRPTTIIFLQYFGPFRCPKFETLSFHENLPSKQVLGWLW